jgi:hypothetical protein
MTAHKQPNAEDLDYVRGVFASLMASAPEGTFTAPVKLVLDDETALAGRTSLRARAASEVLEDGTGVVYIAEVMLDDDKYRQQGVLAHELGHVFLLQSGNEDHSERDADDIALTLFGRRINYDRDDIQTVGPGQHPRPQHLDARSNPGSTPKRVSGVPMHPETVREQDLVPVAYNNTGEKLFHIPAGNWMRSGLALCGHDIARPGWHIQNQARSHPKLCAACLRLDR